MKKKRKHYTPEEKGAILRRHLLCKGLSRSSAMSWAFFPQSGQPVCNATPRHYA